MYTCGITPYDATHLGHAAVYVTYDVLQRRLARPRPRDPVRAQHHRRRRLDPRQGPRARRALPRPGRRRDGPLRRRHGRRSACCESWSEPRATSAIADIRGLHRHGARPRPRLPGRRRRVLRRVHVPRRSVGVGLHAATRCSTFAAERGGNVDDPNKRDPLDFVLWQPSLDDEPSWEIAVGPRPPGLAHRVLGAGAARARHHHRPARRRRRPDLPPPRVRAGPVRGRHRRAVRAPLDAPGDGPDGRREDVEVASATSCSSPSSARSGTRWRSA